MNFNNIMAKAAGWIAPKVNKLELFFIALIILQLLLRDFMNEAINIIHAISFVSLALIYFIFAFSFETNEKPKPMQHVILKILHLGFAAYLLGILWRLLFLPGAINMFAFGLGTTLLSLAYVAYNKIKKQPFPLFTKRIMIRALAFVIVGIALFYANPPKSKIHEVKDAAIELIKE